MTYPLTATNGGTPTPGLGPTWVFFQKFPGGVVYPLPQIQEVSHGLYYFQYNPEKDGDAAGLVDFGATLVNPAERYAYVFCWRSDSRIDSKLDDFISSRLGYGNIHLTK